MAFTVESCVALWIRQKSRLFVTDAINNSLSRLGKQVKEKDPCARDVKPFRLFLVSIREITSTKAAIR